MRITVDTNVLVRGAVLDDPDQVQLAAKVLREADESATVEAGLRMLDSGGDFADGVIAHQGAWLGADEFVSFDKDAVALLTSQGAKARLLS